jgi:hypothetical protein
VTARRSSRFSGVSLYVVIPPGARTCPGHAAPPSAPQSQAVPAPSMPCPSETVAQSGLGDEWLRSARLPSHLHERPAGIVLAPRRGRRSVPSAYEDRLVVPDTLGTTIKLTSSASRRARSPDANGLQPAGQVPSPIYRTGRRDMPRDPLAPHASGLARTGSVSSQPAEGPSAGYGM